MKTKTLLATLLISIFLLNAASPSLAVDTLVASDFKLESWAKTVDYFDYARAYATLHGIETPPGFQNWHAYLYMTYVNTSGLHLLYAGLCNITFGGGAYLTIPMQTFMMHYKTANRSRDVLTASTFLMLLAFNDSEYSIFPNSPDMNDTLWASFSMGFDFSAFNISLPSLNSKTEIIPLTHSNDKLQWSWGMKYTNLTAIWWRTWINPDDPGYNHSAPVAITTYDELTFTYTLTISPQDNKATLTENHVIGRISNLWLFLGWFIVPLYAHYNSSGCYSYGIKLSNETVYEFLQKNQIKMSIVNFQTSVLLDRNTYSLSASGENVTDNEKTVSDSSITTYADDGEKVFDVEFGAKKNYKLYNYTADPSEQTFDTYEAITRTCKINGFAKNTGLFQYHIGLMKFLPLLVVNMHPQLFQKAKETIANMSMANYFYVIAYPNYSGYRVEHDPTFTAYLTTTAADSTAQKWGGIIIISIVAVVVLAAVFMLARRRKPNQPQTQP
ncbi:MAG: hypothetical protein ACPLZC_07245 [Candidatus Bathyarchaeales archaeon]